MQSTPPISDSSNNASGTDDIDGNSDTNNTINNNTGLLETTKLNSVPDPDSKDLQSQDSTDSSIPSQFTCVHSSNLEKRIFSIHPFTKDQFLVVASDNYLKDTQKVYFIHSKDMSSVSGSFFKPAHFKIGYCHWKSHSSFSQNTKILAVGNEKTKKIALYDCMKKKKCAEKKCIQDHLQCLALSPCGSLLAFARIGTNKSVEIYSIPEFIPKNSWNTDDDIVGIEVLTFSPDGKFIFCGDHEGFLLCIQVESAKLVYKTRVFAGESCRVLSINFTPDGKTCLISSFLIVIAFDTMTRKIIRRFASFSDYCNTSAFEPETNSLVVCAGMNLDVIDFETCLVKQKLPTAYSSATEVIVDGKRIISGFDDGTISCWEYLPTTSSDDNQVSDYDGDDDLSKKYTPALTVEIKKQNEHFPFFIASHSEPSTLNDETTISSCPDGEIIVLELEYGSESPKYQAKILNSKTLAEIRSFLLPPKLNLRTCSFLFQNHTLVIIKKLDDTIFVYDTISGKQVLSKDISNSIPQISIMHAVNQSPDGKLIAIADYTKVIIYTANSGDILHVIDTGTLDISHMAFSSKENEILIFYDNKTTIWDFTTQKMIFEDLNLGGSNCKSSHIVGNAAYLGTAGGGCRIFDLDTNTISAHIECGRFNDKIVFSNGYVLTGTFKEFHVSDFQNIVQIFKPPSSLIVSFCSQGSSIFTCTKDDLITKYSVKPSKSLQSDPQETQPATLTTTTTTTTTTSS